MGSLGFSQFAAFPMLSLEGEGTGSILGSLGISGIFKRAAPRGFVSNSFYWTADRVTSSPMTEGLAVAKKRSAGVASQNLADATVQQRPAIQKRLLELIRYAVVDGEQLPQLLSIKGLANFMAEFSLAKTPLLTTDQCGVLVATWKLDRTQMLTIKFLDAFKVQFAWAHKNDHGEIERGWGDAEWAEVVPSIPFVQVFLGVDAQRVEQTFP